jgi:DNA-binding GntR family transcriptional regulator
MARRKNPISVASRPSMDEDPVVKGILKAISLKRIRPGTKLVADQLVEVFGSNRIHIRQVFEHLGSRNIIELYPNRGAYVAQPTPDEARQVFTTRHVLERAAVSALIHNLDEPIRKTLTQHIEREHAHVEEDRWSTLTITGEFHGLIAQLTGNLVLARFIDELVLRTSLIIASFEAHGADDCSPDAHPAIVRHILDGNEPAAIAAMDNHLASMQSRLRFDGPADTPDDIASIFAGLGVKRPRRKAS